MKKILLFLFATSLFISCNFSSFTDKKPASNREKQTVYISIDNFRTAMPTVNWVDFEFMLTAIENYGEANQKAPLQIFNSNRAYAQLSEGFEIDIGKYQFTLDAYKNGVKALSGQTITDLSLGDTSLVFRMFPVEGAKGSAIVTINFPYDDTVAAIKCAVSSDIFAKPDASAQTVDYKVYKGESIATISKENLLSGKEQYLLYWFYDKNGALIYSGAESLIVIGGCTSYSSINLTTADWHSYLCTITLKKDDVNWTLSGRTVTLVDSSNPGRVYTLKDVSGGNFAASVAEGSYIIYVDGINTEKQFNSVNKNASVNYYTISSENIKGCELEPGSEILAGGNDEIIVQEGWDFSYKVNLLRGYEIGENGLSIKQNGTEVESPAFETLYVIKAIKTPQIISVEGVEAIKYHIIYKDNGTDISSTKISTGAYWWILGGEGTYEPPVEFTAENTITLPEMANIRKNNNYFDCWKDEYGNVITTTEGIYSNLSLTANWKKAPYADDENKVIYANGFNLLITSRSAGKNDQTFIYVDYNGDGIKNYDDWQIKCTNVSTGNSNDFSGYELHAGNNEGEPIYSDYTFTMTGGVISAIYGLNSKDNKQGNKSTLNISGTAVIGNVTGESVRVNPDSTKTTIAEEVKGIMLETLYDERVNINAQMTAPYSVICVTPYYYDASHERIIARIANSKFATFSNFTCWTRDSNEDTGEISYSKNLLSQKNVIENGVTRTLVRLADSSGIVLPKPDEVTIGDIDGEFSLGGGTVVANCSVFSINVKGGTFRVNNRTTITANTSDNDKAVEATLTYMAQPTPVTYVEEFSFDESYVYMQVLSAGNQLTPEIASEFLEQLYFKRDDPDVELEVVINLETVPSDLILGEGDPLGGSEFKYFDGSFYKRVKSGSISWSNAYKGAKKLSFNGLDGYLMNITSEVENNYIYETFRKIYSDALSWGGGCRYIPTKVDPVSGETVPVYDAPEISKKTIGDVWRWQAGPEAGQIFWNSKLGNTIADIEKGIVDGMYYKWNNHMLFPDRVSADLNDPDPTKEIRGRTDTNEPNGSDEYCMQFLAGKMSPGGGKNDYYANGYWNDSGDSARTDSYASTGYIVEFTPYETEYGKQEASYLPIKRTAKY